METVHVPVMAEEVLELLSPGPGKVYVDCTLGGGGHASAVWKSIQPDGVLLGIDRDPKAVGRAKTRLDGIAPGAKFACGRFGDLPSILQEFGIFAVDGIVADLGFSRDQLEDGERGFSFLREGPLDMRMDPHREGPTAADLVNGLSEAELARLFRDYGEEEFAKRIARVLAAERGRAPVATTARLAELVSSAVPAKARRRIHPATQVFQSLRIAVNDEMGELSRFLGSFFDFLAPSGVCAVISFHSLEDRMVKTRFRELTTSCVCPKDMPCICGGKAPAELLTRKAKRPSEREVADNPLSRSARLRAIRKAAERRPS
ncbi:MAG: 16S rRNA (cytosine(1402)-N(4))-methyltransferase RsmH [Thermodesulfobacteriota bacterium]